MACNRELSRVKKINKEGERVVVFSFIVVCIVLLFQLRFLTKTNERISLFPFEKPLDARLVIYPTIIPTAISGQVIQQIPLTDLTIVLKNNVSYRLTGIKLILPSAGFDTIESPDAKRNTSLAYLRSNLVFNIDKIDAGKTFTATISAFSTEPGTFSFPIQVVANEGIITWTNVGSFTAK